MDAPRQAAVMILLYPEGEQVYTVFIKRNEYPGVHSGQISFPGGMYEDPDRTLERTAIRETAEETGIDQELVEVLGSLTPLYIPISNFRVTPFVGWCGITPRFDPDGTEVQYLVTTPVADLLDPQNLRKGVWVRNEAEMEAPYLSIRKEMIWGATAMMLSEFIELALQMPQFRS